MNLFQYDIVYHRKACQDFGLTISLKKTQVMGRGMDSPPSITISTQELEVVHDFM